MNCKKIGGKLNLRKMEELTFDRHQSLILRQELIDYLKKNKYITKIIRSCKIFVMALKRGSPEFPLCRPIMTFDIIMLRDASPILAQVLGAEPLMWSTMLEEIVYLTVKATLKSPDQISRNQVQTPIRVQGSWNPILDHRHGGLETFKAVLISKEPSQKYIMQSVWKCDEQCDGAIIEIGLPRNAPKCSSCNSVTVEQASGRITGDNINITLTQLGANDSLINIKKVSVKDELTAEALLVVGGVYIVSVVADQAWSLERVKIETNRIPLENSSSKYVEWMTRELGKDWLPADAMTDLREGLVLSLASLQEPMNEESGSSPCDDGPLHVLALGTQYWLAWRLMVEALTFVPRWSCNGSVKILLPTDLTHASGMQAVINDLETGRQKGVVWVAGPRMGPTGIPKHIAALINVFGIYYNAELEEPTMEQLTNQRLAQAMGYRSGRSKDDTKLGVNKIIQIYDNISNHRINMDAKSMKLLKDYFLAVRRDRPDIVPLKALQTLCGLWRSRSRLSRRATPVHALKAARLHASATNLYSENEYDEDIMLSLQCTKVGDIPLAKFGSWFRQYVITMLGPEATQTQT